MDLVYEWEAPLFTLFLTFRKFSRKNLLFIWNFTFGFLKSQILREFNCFFKEFCIRFDHFLKIKTGFFPIKVAHRVFVADFHFCLLVTQQDFWGPIIDENSGGRQFFCDYTSCHHTAQKRATFNNNLIKLIPILLKILVQKVPSSFSLSPATSSQWWVINIWAHFWTFFENHRFSMTD